MVVATLKGGGFADRDADATVSSTYEVTGSTKNTDGKHERYLTRVAGPALDTQIIGTSAEHINAPRSLALSTRAGGHKVDGTDDRITVIGQTQLFRLSYEVTKR